MSVKEALQVAGIDRATFVGLVDDGVRFSLQNWSKLHPELAKLGPNIEGVTMCRVYLVLELTRPQEPRPFYLDRIYKRMSSLRRDMERDALSPYLNNLVAAEAA